MDSHDHGTPGGYFNGELLITMRARLTGSSSFPEMIIVFGIRDKLVLSSSTHGRACLGFFVKTTDV